MPKTVHDALEYLNADEALKSALPIGLVDDYIVMKAAEQKMLDEMPEADRRVWLIERY
jgi:glutamine synthetase